VIITERKLFGILPYTTVFFPSAGAMMEIVHGLGPSQLARFFWTAAETEPPERLVEHRPTATVCIDLRNTTEELWSAISKNGRNEIRGAERLDTRVRIACNGVEARADFLSLYNTFARTKAEVSQISTHVLDRYGNHADIFVAYLDDRPTCAHVYLKDPSLGRARLLFSASRRLEDPHLSRLCGNLNRLLHWREMCRYREDGFITYDFGGIREDENDGIARFKRSFGGKVTKEHTYLCAGLPRIGVALERVREKLRRHPRRARREQVAQQATVARGSGQGARDA
jgi:hypothetical protein